VALEVRDIDFHPNGTGQALIRRGKTDAEGQGRVAYLSRTTVRWLKVWLEHAGVEEGAVFRRLVGKDHIGGALNPGSIALIFKRVAQWIGMPARYVAAISGHSIRVGATQDLAALDIDLAAITQAGGWKSPRMPLQYAEKINAARSGMARVAEKTGRDSITDERACSGGQPIDRLVNPPKDYNYESSTERYPFRRPKREDARCPRANL